MTKDLLYHCVIVSLLLSTPAHGQSVDADAAPSLRNPLLSLTEQSPLTPAVPDAAPAIRRFTTDFAHDEQPVTADGAWHHAGTYWAVVRSLNGHAMGTQTGSRGYDDSYAYLNGFPPDQTARATLWFAASSDGDYREVELLLRWSDAPNRARGYECNLAWNGAYAEIVRWNGAPGDFSYITRQHRFAPGIMPPATGDRFTANITGSDIRVWLNKHDGLGDRLIAAGHDTTFSDGGPGMGFFIQGRVDPSRFGFASFTATSN